MKKTLRFSRFTAFLCLIAFMSGFFIFPADAKSVDETISDADLLVRLDILNPDYVAEEDKILTRAEFIAAAMSLCIIETGDITDVYFTDVPYNHTYAYEINKAYKLGYIKGFGGGLCKPDENITPEQAMSVLMKIIGYDILADASGSSLTAAYRYGFMDGVRLTNEITFGNTVKILRNILESRTAELTLSGDTQASVEINKDEHFFDKLFDIYIGTGVVEAVGDISYSEDIEAGEGYAVIDGKKYLTGGLDMRQYIGSTVRFYYKDDDYFQDLKVVLLKDSDSVTVANEDILSITKSGDKYIVNYETDGRDKKLKVSGYYDCIYNGSLYKDFDISDLDDMFTGQVTFVSRGDEKSDNYNLLIVDEYRAAVLEDVNYDEEILYFTDKTLYGKSMKKYEMPFDYNIYDADGTEIVFNNLKSGYSVLIAENNSGDYVKVLASNELTLHTLKGISREDGTITLDSGEYNLSRDFNLTNNRLVYSEELPYYFDARGNVIAISDDNIPSEHYGYLISSYKDETDDSVRISLIDESGDKKVFELCSMIYINSGKYKMEDVMKSSELFLEEKVIPQLIKYRTISEKIKNIYTAEDNSANADYIGFDENQFTCDYYKAANAFIRYNPKVIDNKYIIDMNTSIFIIPSDVRQAEKFEVVRLDYFQNDYSELSDIRVYDSDSCKSARIVTLSSDSILPQNSLFVLEDNVTMVDEETNEIVSRLAGYYEGKYKELDMCEGVKCEASKGDCMTVTLERGKVIDYQILASASTKANIIEKNLTSSSGFNGNWVIALGNVYKKSAGALTLSYGEQLSKVAFPVLSTCYIYKFDTKLKTVSVVDYNEITVGSRIFIHRASDQAKSIVLYE